MGYEGRHTGITNGSVTTQKLQNGVVTKATIHHNAVTTSRIANNAVNTNKLRDGAVTAAKLDASARGFRSIVVREQVTTAVANNAVGAVTADCNSGEVATGGGGFLLDAFSLPAVVRSYPSVLGAEGSLNSGDVPQAWTTRIFNNSGATNHLEGWVLCASM